MKISLLNMFAQKIHFGYLGGITKTCQCNIQRFFSFLEEKKI